MIREAEVIREEINDLQTRIESTEQKKNKHKKRLTRYYLPALAIWGAVHFGTPKVIEQNFEYMNEFQSRQYTFVVAAAQFQTCVNLNYSPTEKTVSPSDACVGAEKTYFAAYKNMETILFSEEFIEETQEIADIYRSSMIALFGVAALMFVGTYHLGKETLLSHKNKKLGKLKEEKEAELQSTV